MYFADINSNAAYHKNSDKNINKHDKEELESIRSLDITSRHSHHGGHDQEKEEIKTYRKIKSPSKYTNILKTNQFQLRDDLNGGGKSRLDRQSRSDRSERKSRSDRSERKSRSDKKNIIKTVINTKMTKTKIIKTEIIRYPDKTRIVKTEILIKDPNKRHKIQTEIQNMKKPIETEIVECESVKAIQTEIVKFDDVEEHNNNRNIIQTDITSRSAIETKTIHGNQVQQNTQLKLNSYLTNDVRTIYLNKRFSNGSYNCIYNFSTKKYKKLEDKIIIRITNEKANRNIRSSELKGIKIQYDLSIKSPFIATVIDYGKVVGEKNEYSMVKKYGISLKTLLESMPKFTNMGVVLKFMKDFLTVVKCIHDNDYAHLDLKPSNILLDNIWKISKPKKVIASLDFAVIDFGGARKFTDDKSLELDGQMGSAAYSPPEIMEIKFGKKNDIWAYGIICYLVCVRKFFFKANGPEIFMNEDKKEVEKNVLSAIKKLKTSILPSKTKKQEKSKYLEPLTKDTFGILIDFFKLVFTVDPEKRPNASQLLKHPLMSFV